jgi:chemotaxis signal transduction protein
MIDAQTHVSGRAAELRRAFDRSFVEARHFKTATTQDFLSIVVGGDPYALRLGDVAGLHSDKKITALPSRVAELRGIAGFRGSMLPVYDLAALLRYPEASSPRWLVIAAGAPVALAIDHFDGHFRVPSDSIASHEGERSREHLHQILRTEDFVRPIINVPSLVAAIRERAQANGLQQEN